jgi:hypothetical protein
VRTFLVLHALRVRGRSAPEVALFTGLPLETCEVLLSDLVATEQVRPGFSLLPTGTAAHAVLRDDELEVQSQLLVVAYTSFIPLNAVFKQLCTDWQLLPGDRLNDHTDAAYDRAVIDRLGPVHDAVHEVVAATGRPRFRAYLPRFAAALEGLRGGDLSALTRPLTESYHDVWMELHEDLLVSLDWERSEDDG